MFFSLRNLLLFASFCCTAGAQVQTFFLPPTSLTILSNPSCSAAALTRAKAGGMEFTDRPSIGSGLALAGTNEFWGITDRGPNGKTSEDDEAARRTFPLPDFCPAIVRLQLADGKIRITQSIPLADARGKLITGRNNLETEERLFESPTAPAPLPSDPNGVDPEAIRVLPDGKFLLSEEYSPSILVIATNGEVLVRYTPRSKPLPNATYPVKAILPDVFARRRINKGFESLALSHDGRFAYAILQSPMGRAESRVVRVLKLDVSQPLDAKVAGEYLALQSRARDYSAKQKQDKLSWGDADWIAPDQLLVIEHGKGRAKLLLVDFSRATNLLGRDDEPTLAFEDARRLSGVRPASTREVFSTAAAPQIDSDKLEGLAVLGSNEVAIANDNDFGIGDVRGQPSKLWIVRLPKPLPVVAK